MGKVAWSSWVFFSTPLPLPLPFVIVLPLMISANFDSKFSPKLLDHEEVLRAEVHVDDPLIGYEMSPY